jgi:hypothetical protein
MKTTLFNFDDLSAKSKETKAVMKIFSKAGSPVVSQEVSPSTRRTAGVSFKEVFFTFGDSQTAVFRIKQTGDIFQVLVNGKVVPIRNQEDQERAVLEIISFMDSGRSRFQKKLAAVAVKLPPSIRTAAPKMETLLIQRRDTLKEMIEEIKSEILAVQAA